MDPYHMFFSIPPSSVDSTNCVMSGPVLRFNEELISSSAEEVGHASLTRARRQRVIAIGLCVCVCYCYSLQSLTSKDYWSIRTKVHTRSGTRFKRFVR